jgi:hypothetical protein
MNQRTLGPGRARDARRPVSASARRATAASPRRSPAVLRARHQRRSLVFVIAAVVAVVAVVGVFGALRSGPALTPLQARIVSIAQSQLGYSTDPSSSYCNKFSAYWESGTSCGNGLAAEEWCADFAAWAWQKAGVQFTYGYGPGEINGGAVTFYEWGVANGEWHPTTSGFVAAPGDVAIYGLSVGAGPSAAHVAIVTDDAPGQSGPDVVNGDGDRTGFSRVETGIDQLQVDVGQDEYTLAGYVTPP